MSAYPFVPGLGLAGTPTEKVLDVVSNVIPATLRFRSTMTAPSVGLPANSAVSALLPAAPSVLPGTTSQLAGVDQVLSPPSDAAVPGPIQLPVIACAD